MNRRDFLKSVGAVSVAGVVGKWFGWLSPSRDVAYSYDVPPKIRSAASMLHTIDPNDMPLLQMMGRGEKVSIGDWPTARYTWVADVGGIKPLQPGHPNYFDYTNYVDTDPFKDEEPYLDW